MLRVQQILDLQNSFILIYLNCQNIMGRLFPRVSTLLRRPK